VVKENLAIIYDEWETLTMGIQILFPSDLAKYIISNIEVSDTPEHIKKLRIDIIQKLSQVSDRSVRRDMLEINKAIAHNLHSDYFITPHRVSASCTGIPDTGSGGKCENITSNTDQIPKQPHDYLGHLGHELRKRSVPAMYTNTTYCVQIIPCIYETFTNSSGKKNLFLIPGWPDACSMTCEDVLQYQPIGSWNESLGRWKIGHQSFPCHTRRQHSLICKNFPSESTCICEVLIQATESSSQISLRMKHSVRSLFRSVTKLLRKTPTRIWHALKKHPFRSTGTILGGAAGVYTIYELIDNNYINPLPSHRELAEYFNDMREKDQAILNVTNSVYLMLGQTRQNVLDTIAGVESWSDQLTLIASIFSTTSARIREGINMVSRGRVPYTILASDVIVSVQQLLLPYMDNEPIGELTYPMQLINCDISLNTLWVGIRIPKSTTSMVGRVYHSQGRVHTIHSSEYLCKNFVGSSYFFAPVIQGMEVKASHILHQNLCLKTSPVWLCPFESLEDIHTGAEKSVCWKSTLPLRTKRQTVDSGNQQFISDLLNRSTFPKGSDYPVTDVNEGFLKLEKQYLDLQQKVLSLSDKANNELKDILTSQEHHWGLTTLEQLFVTHTTRRATLPVRPHVSLLHYADKGTHYRLENIFKL
jgi:hypothetical protein